LNRVLAPDDALDAVFEALIRAVFRTTLLMVTHIAVAPPRRQAPATWLQRRSMGALARICLHSARLSRETTVRY
jgi:hypothetical protein